MSRDNNIYAYVGDGDTIINIVDGEPRPLLEFNQKTGKVIIKIHIDPSYCYISDLDLYDTVKRAMELDEQTSTREGLASHYWQQVIPLSNYQPGRIRRPEVMITVDVLPRDLMPIAAS